MKPNFQPGCQDLRFHHDKTNRKGRKGHKGIRVSESSCVSPGCVGFRPSTQPTFNHKYSTGHDIVSKSSINSTAQKKAPLVGG
ncbi:hypothetical protein NIES4074_46290 [Cylindrospermum sp. NIES-4074]|nr:hypothetical protein NIES4074_46290 [Cylindrospermum sp. NIES-4074]